MSTLSDVSFRGHRFCRKLLMGDYIFFGRDHFKIYCVIFLLGQGLEMFFSYFSSGMLVVIAAACFNSPGIIALCWNILYQ